MAKQLVVENAVIDSLVNNEQLLNMFPTLKTAASTRVKTGCCGKRLVPDYANVKRAILGLGLIEKEGFKQMLGVSQVSIVHRVGGQQRIESF